MWLPTVSAETGFQWKLNLWKVYWCLADVIADCFGRNRCHLICITQEIRYHRTSQPIKQKVWTPDIHTNYSSPFVVFNYKGIPDSCSFCCGVNLQITLTYHQTPGSPGYPTYLPSQYWLFLCPCCDCGQYRSLSLSPWIMAFVIALAQILKGQQLPYSRLICQWD